MFMMYRLLSLVLATIGIVDALPKAQILASDGALPRRQIDVCVKIYGDRVAEQCSPVYSINLAGQTVVEDAGSTLTLPTGLSDATTATFSNGDVITITPSDILIQTSDNEGNTVISNANSAVTIPANVTTTLTTALPDGETTTVTPPSQSESITTSAVVQTTTSDGVTIIIGDQGTLTLPTAVTTPITTTLPNGQETTISFPATTESSSPTTSGSPGAFIFPVTTPVPEPKPTDGGVVSLAFLPAKRSVLNVNCR